MEFFPSVASRAESDATAERIRRHFVEHGFGLWAAELPGVAGFIGFVGLAHVPFAAPFTPAVEIGWRLAADHWGHGYATGAGGARRGLWPARPRRDRRDDGAGQHALEERDGEAGHASLAGR
jgi:hypothetical protein